MIKQVNINIRQHMFKNNDKRFEYDIGSSNPDEMERYSVKYQNNRAISEYAISNTTPLHKKSINSYIPYEQRTKHHISIHDHSSYEPEKIQERYAQRGRANSSSAIKRGIQNHTVKTDKSYLGNDAMKQTKKVYFGRDQYNQKQKQTVNNYYQYENNRNDQNRRFNGQKFNNGPYPQKINNSFKKGENMNIKVKRNEHNIQIPNYGNINEKEIMQKIGRINKLNEEINSRLQRMLNKIDV